MREFWWTFSTLHFVSFCSHLVCAGPFCSSFLLDAQSLSLFGFTAICCKMMTQRAKEKTMNETLQKANTPKGNTPKGNTQGMHVAWMLQTPHFVVAGLVPVRFVASSLLLDASLKQYRNEKETGKITEKREHREKTGNKRNTDTIRRRCICGLTVFFPTCQVRVVRFYVWCPSSFLPRSFFFRSFLPSSFLFFLLFASSSSSSQTSSPSSSPDVARCQHGPPDCSGQRRTSIGSSRLQWAAPDLNSGLQIAVGSAGPQPGSSGADWATPDLGDLPSGVGSAGPQLPEDMSEDVSERMSEDMSEEMSERMSEDMSEEMSEDMSEEMSEDMSKDMPEIRQKRMPE